jgi:hypothetical protein
MVITSLQTFMVDSLQEVMVKLDPLIPQSTSSLAIFQQPNSNIQMDQPSSGRARQ